MKKITFNVKGMHCKSCEMLVTDSLQETNGVKKADASHIKGTVTVEYDEKQVPENKLKEIIKNEGYEVV